jgi:hypothetical protein
MELTLAPSLGLVDPGVPGAIPQHMP